MKMKMSLPVVMLLLASLTACDRIGGDDFRKERSARLYKTAMEDYRAGRLTQAVEGLKKVCSDDPSNASARFQLACLLQDSAKDYFGAACAYREYLAQRGGSEKGALAKDRLAACERELAQVLASKYRLNDVAEQTARNAALQEELKTSAARHAKLQKDLATAMQRIAHLVQESERLKSLMKTDEGEAGARATDVTEALALLQEEDTESKTHATDVSDVQEHLKDTSEETVSSPKVGDDAATVNALLEEETKETPLLTHTPAAKEKRDAARKVAEEAAARRAAAEAAEKAKRPETYVVADGDTLYKIATRFYGRASEWKRIRDANKAIISTDGRVKTGQKLVLP